MAAPPRVLLHNDQTDALKARLVADFPQVELATCATYEGLGDKIAAFRPDVVYSVRFAGTPGFPRDPLFATGGPRWIANGGAGTDHFGAWDTGHVTVTNAAGAAADMMAEYVMGGFLHFSLDIPGLQADKGAGVWQARTVVPLLGKTLLIVGLGHTGRAIAARAKAFGMQVLGTRVRPQLMDNVDEVHGAQSVLALLPRADFISITTPLTDRTRGLIGEAEVAVMKRGAVIADVSRGGVVDQTALLKALMTGHLGGAALDVFEVEPLPADSPMWQIQNLIISPHCSSVHAGWEDASFDLFLGNLRRFLAGEELINIVDPVQGY